MATGRGTDGIRLPAGQPHRLGRAQRLLPQLREGARAQGTAGRRPRLVAPRRRAPHRRNRSDGRRRSGAMAQGPVARPRRGRLQPGHRRPTSCMGDLRRLPGAERLRAPAAPRKGAGPRPTEERPERRRSRESLRAARGGCRLQRGRPVPARPDPEGRPGGAPGRRDAVGRDRIARPGTGDAARIQPGARAGEVLEAPSVAVGADLRRARHVPQRQRFFHLRRPQHGRRVRLDDRDAPGPEAPGRFPSAAARGVPRGHRPDRPVVAEEDRPADAHVDHLPRLRRALLPADLFHRLQAPRRSDGVE